VRFGDFLRTTVLASAGGASALIVATLAGVNGHDDPGVVWIALGWWLASVMIGMWLGRDSAVSESIGSLLAAARTQSSLPDLAPARTFLNRLWPLMLCTALAAGLSILVPQVPAVVAGFMIIWAFAWRRQGGAVKAIEDRDGARFYLDRTRAWEPIRLVRTPGFRATLVDVHGLRPSPGQPPAADRA
jgi:hypothetical protein